MNTATRILLALGAASALAAPAAMAGMNPAAMISRPAGYMPSVGDPAAGKTLFFDTKLSSNGMSCATCHAHYGSFKDTFAQPYPHTVAMAKNQFHVDPVYLDEMIQGCMVGPMATKPLPWNSRELADLTAYVAQYQKGFQPTH